LALSVVEGGFLCEVVTGDGKVPLPAAGGIPVVSRDATRSRRMQMLLNRRSVLTNPLYWDMKIKIAILTLATFVALC
jgi:hypothetical protein